MIDQPQGEMPEREQRAEEKPALTVVIKSWWTPALALIMLVAGLLAGYFGRPLIDKNALSSDGVTALVTPGAAVETASPTATIDPKQVQQIMDSIVAKTTNFMGDATATVTLIEFSDYQ